MNRKIKDRLMPTVMLCIMLILGGYVYILTNGIKVDFPKTAKVFQALGCFGIGLGIVTWAIRILRGKPYDNLKEAWQVAITRSIIIMIVGIQVIILILVSYQVESDINKILMV